MLRFSDYIRSIANNSDFRIKIKLILQGHFIYYLN